MISYEVCKTAEMLKKKKKGRHEEKRDNRCFNCCDGVCDCCDCLADCGCCAGLCSG